EELRCKPVHYAIPQQLQSPKRKDYSQSRASKGQQKTFNHQLPNDTPATPSQSQADSDFPLTRSSTRQHHIREICASDQQHETYDKEDSYGGDAETNVIDIPECRRMFQSQRHCLDGFRACPRVLAQERVRFRLGAHHRQRWLEAAQQLQLIVRGTIQ